MERYNTTEDWARMAAQITADLTGDPLVRPTGADAPIPLPVPPLARCGLCGSPHVLVVGLAWNMDHHSGDAHYGYEVICEECHKFSAFAHLETAGECDTLWTQARQAQARRRAAKQTFLARITARLTAHDIH